MPGSNSRPNVSEGYEVPLSYRGDRPTEIIAMQVHTKTEAKIHADQKYNSVVLYIVFYIGFKYSKENLNASNKWIQAECSMYYFDSCILYRSTSLVARVV